jgi:SNF2 family DNA or RNA helicase
MIPPLYEHQKKIIRENKLKCGLFLGTGASKTRTALEMAEGDTLVICPKQQRDDETWQRENEKWQTKKILWVISKEDLRKQWDTLPNFTTVIIDEVHCCLGVLPAYVQRKNVQYPKTSQIFEATQKFLAKHPPKRLYLLSATPIPKPMSMWAIGILLGQKWDFNQFRMTYYKEIRMGGMRRIWIPRMDEETKQRLADLVQKFGYTGCLNDFFDVPEQTHKVVEIEPSVEQKRAMTEISFAEADPLVRRARLRTIENGVLYGKKIDTLDGKTDKMSNETKIFKSHKIDYILERALEFPKLLIFANYTAQIEEIARVLREEGYTVSTLTGQTKDRSFIRTVDESSEPHIIIAQSSISSGYELPSFPCVIYASKSWRYVDYEQSLGRVLRSNHLKKNLYIHLVVKGTDLDCHKAIMSGVDFQEKLTLNI